MPYGVGDDLAAKIRTTVETGELPGLEAVRQRVPDELANLTGIAQLGPKRVRALYRDLGVRSLGDLERAIREGKVKRLKGFGGKTEARILDGLHELRRVSQRMLLPEAARIAEDLVEWLSGAEDVEAATVAGSYRRRLETVGDLDLLVICERPARVMQRFVDYDAVEQVVSHGSTRSTVYLRSGLQVDLRVVPRESYGSAMHYFTGSKAHNVAIRTIAARKGLKINEYGIFRGEQRIGGATEEEVFASVALPWIPPELREDRGEIEAARSGALPCLIVPDDLRGDLHAHTHAADGRDSLEDMAAAARELGYEYLAITDRSERLTITDRLNWSRLREQMEAIDALNERLDGFTLLKGIEVDILEDGKLELPDSVLRDLDLVVCSVQSDLGLSRRQQTRRVLKAMDSPWCTIIAHPTGRLIHEREPMDLDLDAVMRGAAERGIWLEVNAQPSRLDLKDTDIRRAKELGVRLVLSSDAYSAAQLRQIRLGVDQARRGWLEKADAVNTRSPKELRKLLQARRP